MDEVRITNRFISKQMEYTKNMGFTKIELTNSLHLGGKRREKML